MYFYYLIFFLPLLPIVFKNKSLISSFFIFLNLFFFIFFIGLRSEVGGDWRQLYYAANNYSGVSFYDFFSNLPTELLYASVIYFSVNLGAGIFGSNLIFAAIFVYCLHKYLKSLPYYFFSFSISVPVLVIILAMGYTQQSVAFGFCLLAILALRENKTILFVIYVFIACLFHISAVFLLLLYSFKFNLSGVIKLFVLIILLLLFILFILDPSDLWLKVNFYVGKGIHFESKGGIYRIGINLISAIIFLSFVRKRVLNIHDKKIYTKLSLLAIIVFFTSFYSSTFSDRINFFVYPLHLYAVTHFLYSFKYKFTKYTFSLIIIFLYTSLLSFWFFVGHHSANWYPYTMYPFNYRVNSCLFNDTKCLVGGSQEFWEKALQDPSSKVYQEYLSNPLNFKLDDSQKGRAKK